MLDKPVGERQRMRARLRLSLVIAVLLLVMAACHPSDENRAAQEMVLAEFTESYVNVSITLEHVEAGKAVLEATFTPTEPDAHLYSMQLPRDGIDGLGRPTLIELPFGEGMRMAGELQESQPSQEDSVASDLPSLPVYPAGPVTLSLAVTLPEGSGLVNDQVIITYMACTPRGCHKPVMSKLVDVQVPTR